MQFIELEHVKQFDGHDKHWPSCIMYPDKGQEGTHVLFNKRRPDIHDKHTSGELAHVTQGVIQRVQVLL